jgi:voltage-gated potassium channel
LRDTAFAMSVQDEPLLTGVRRRLQEIIFEAETPAGKAFDVGLILAILLSVAAVMLESVEEIRAEHGVLLRIVEWIFTGLFTVEYLLRIYCTARPIKYVRSFFGIVDVVSIAPTLLSVILPGAQSLQVIRALRLLRIFRVLKLAHYLGEANVLKNALYSSRPKITVFLIAVVNIAAIFGALMYLVEGRAGGFDNIPHSMYWAIVTMTTVGYGDIAPVTAAGRLLATLLMLMGYGIIAVPTGIVSAELARAERPIKVSTHSCPSCAQEGHSVDAVYCKYCSAHL